MGPVGLLLAAGAGTRMGQPKALVHDPDGTSWLVRAIDVLLEGGCSSVTVVLGASAAEASLLVESLAPVRVVVATDWARGMSASLAAGLASLDVTSDAALVSLVDLPDVSAAVVARVASAVGASGASALARATYFGRPGHPVLLGRDHWAAIAADASGDHGARSYLQAHDVTCIECGDLATGQDLDAR